MGKFDLALEELQSAIHINPGNAEYWALKAHVCAFLGRRDAALTACTEAEGAIDFGSATEQQEAIGRLTDAYRVLGNRTAVDTIARRSKLGLAIAKALANPRSARQQLREQLNRCETYWEKAFVERHLGEQLLKSDDACDLREAADRFASAERHLNASAERHLEREDATDIRRWGLLGNQARAIARQSERTGDRTAPIRRTGEALPLAERGVADDPLSFPAWRALAIVREQGGDYESACTAWSRAHLLEPEEPDCRVALALCQWQHAMWVGSADERRGLLREALDHLNGALRLYDTAQMEKRRRAQWWSAMCRWALGEFAEMPRHLWCILASLEKADPTPEDSALKALVN